MENKYNKNIRLEDREEYKLADYDYATSFKFDVVKVRELNTIYEDEEIIGEYPLSLVINGNYSNTFLCTPENLDELVIGFLMNKGIVESKSDIKSLEIDFKKRIAYAEVDDSKNIYEGEKFYLNEIDYINLKSIGENTTITNVSGIYNVMRKNLTASELFKNTGGVHSVGIYDNEDLIVVREDVARHNAMDKAIGYCISNDIKLSDKIVLLSGRVSCEMILKAAKSGIPIVISKSAPTNLSIDIAKKLNITLAGFVRGDRMNIYTYPERIVIE